MIATRSTKSGLPALSSENRCPAKLLGHFDSYSVKVRRGRGGRGYAMLNFSGHRVRANYSAAGREAGETNAINTRLSIKTCPCKSIFGRAIFFSPRYQACRFRSCGRFFPVAPTTRTITRLRYVRLRGVARVVFPFAHGFFSPPAAFPIFRTRIRIRCELRQSHTQQRYTRCGCVARLSTRRGEKSVSSEITAAIALVCNIRARSPGFSTAF